MNLSTECQNSRLQHRHCKQGKMSKICNQSLKSGTFPGESGFLGVKRRSWAGTWQRGERWKPGWWPRWEQIRADDQMTDLIRSDYHDEKVLRGTVKEVLGELSKGNAVLVHCAQGKYVYINIDSSTSFFSFIRPKSDHWLPLPPVTN